MRKLTKVRTSTRKLFNTMTRKVDRKNFLGIERELALSCRDRVLRDVSENILGPLYEGETLNGRSVKRGMEEIRETLKRYREHCLVAREWEILLKEKH